MTPADIITAARDLYNASGDSFYGDTLIYNWIWQGCHEFAKKTWLMEATSSQSTVAGTQSYSYPTNAIAIKRVTVNGKKLKRITFREDDAITLSNAAVATQGYPIYYTDFNSTINLRPIPDSVYTMVVYYYSDQPQITSGTTPLIIPTLFQFDLVDYVLYRMFAKDKDFDSAQFHLSNWMMHIKDALSYKTRLKRTDSFATVQSEETLPVTILGEA
jgi:hypothetical protein